MRLVNEDLFRELGYMLPQSKNTHDLLKEINNDVAKELLKIEQND